MIPFQACAHCASNRFLAGPRAGLAQNFTCMGCGAMLNLLVAPYPGPLLLLDELSAPTGKPPDMTGAAYVIEILRHDD